MLGLKWKTPRIYRLVMLRKLYKINGNKIKMGGTATAASTITPSPRKAFADKDAVASGKVESNLSFEQNKHNDNHKQKL